MFQLLDADSGLIVVITYMNLNLKVGVVKIKLN